MIKHNYKSCCLWKDVKLTGIKDIDDKLKLFVNKSGKMCDDIGCDIVGINFDNSIDFIQCKDYNMLNSIKILFGIYFWTTNCVLFWKIKLPNYKIQ